jgi:hypothetical protein
MTKLLKGIAAFLIAAAIAYFFLIDGLIKTQLERQGSLALQAPLDIGKVTFHLLPTSLTMRDVQLGSARLPTYNLAQADEISLPFSLRDLFAHKLIIDAMEIHGLRFNRPRNQQTVQTSSNTESATNSPQLREALQRIQQTLNHPLASNTVDPNASVAGAVLADQFKPLLAQITAALNIFATSSADIGDWQILLRRIDVDGAFDFGTHSNDNNGALNFAGTIDNVTPQPKLFDVVTQIDLRNADSGPATLHLSGVLDKRKLAQATLRFDVNNFPLSQWPLSNDSELKIVILNANANIQTLLSLTGNQFDLNAIMHFQRVRLDIASGDSEVARAIADVWRRTDNFDLNLQASGELKNPVLKLNSSLDVQLADALRQLQPSSAFPPTNSFPAAP